MVIGIVEMSPKIGRKVNYMNVGLSPTNDLKELTANAGLFSVTRTWFLVLNKSRHIYQVLEFKALLHDFVRGI